jgi:hypothetical protein
MRRTGFRGVALVCLTLCGGADAAANVTGIAAGGNHFFVLAADGAVDENT